jgi:serine/threonine-protein kinase
MVGEYRVESLIGRGGMGWVYAARQPVIDKRVAVKVLRSDFLDDEDSVRRFVDEARAVNLICHPNIVDIFSFGRLETQHLYLVMERLSGRTLRARMEEGEPFDPPECEQVIRGMLRALDAAHQAGVVHRDLKPDNVFLVYLRNEPVRVKLLDFGVAKLTEKGVLTGRTETGAPIGTPYYMSPEQCRGRAVDGRSDIYSVGVMLYELFCGRLPFSGGAYMDVLFAHVERPPSPPSRWAPVDPRVERVILDCLKKDPALRPQSPEELLERILPLLKDGAVPPLPESGHPGIEDGSTTEHPTEAGTEGGSEDATEPYLPADRMAGPVSFDTEASAAAESITEPARRPRAALLAALALVVAAGVGLVWWSLREPLVDSDPSGSKRTINRSEPSAELKGDRAPSRSSEPRGKEPASVPTEKTASHRPHRSKRPVRRPSQQTVAISLGSQPPGAVVYLDGRARGTTPTTLELPVSSEPVRLRFVSRGRTQVVEQIVPSEPRFVRVVLPPKGTTSPPRNAKGDDKNKRRVRKTGRAPSRSCFDVNEFKLRR